MRSLIYEANKCEIKKPERILESNTKPEFSFEYDALAYDFAIGLGKIILNNEVIELTEAQQSEISAYIDTVEADEQAQLNLDSAAYLSNTDWYVTRKAEQGAAIPMDVLTRRQAAREAIIRE